MREIVHIQAGQCGNQIGAKVNAGRWAPGWTPPHLPPPFYPPPLNRGAAPLRSPSPPPREDKGGPESGRFHPEGRPSPGAEGS